MIWKATFMKWFEQDFTWLWTMTLGLWPTDFPVPRMSPSRPHRKAITYHRLVHRQIQAAVQCHHRHAHMHTHTHPHMSFLHINNMSINSDGSLLSPGGAIQDLSASQRLRQIEHGGRSSWCWGGDTESPAEGQRGHRESLAPLPDSLHTLIQTLSRCLSFSFFR